MKFEHADFSKHFPDDRYNHLSKLAKFIWDLTDCETSDKESKRIAIKLAMVEYVRVLKEQQDAPPTHESAQPCGCDPGASWICEAHRGER